MHRRVIVCIAFGYILALCTAQTLVTDGSSRRVLQQNNEVEVTAGSVERLPTLVSEARRNTVFVITSNIVLPATIFVTENRLTFRGDAETRPIISCSPGNLGFQIKSNRIVFQNLIIRGCENTAIHVLDEPESEDVDDIPFADDYNPFDPDSVAERQQQIADAEPRPPSGPRNLTILFKNVDFVENVGVTLETSAGALSVGARVSATVRSCRFQNNAGIVGGAIAFSGNSLLVEDSVFIGNEADNTGGAIYAIQLENPQASRKDPSVRFRIRNSVFRNNKALKGGEDRGGLRIEQGVDLETTEYLTLPLPTPSGGAIFVHDFNDVQIADCNFTSNSAVPAGGAIYLSDNKQMLVTACRFVGNSVEAPSRTAKANDLKLGGGIFAAFTNDDSTLTVSRSVFVNNRATYGGGVHFVGPVAGKVHYSRCIFERNEASLGGGALALRNAATPIVETSLFRNNSAFVGGAIFLTNGAGLTLAEANKDEEAIRLSDNVAFDGGAIFTIGGGNIRMTKAFLERNRAQRNGGAICSIDARAGGIFNVQDARMFNNSAENGGAMFLENVPDILLDVGPRDPNAEFLGIDKKPQGKFFDNLAVSGGAIYYRASNLVKNLYVMDEAFFRGNKVYPNVSMVHEEPLSFPDANKQTRRLLQTSVNKIDVDESLLTDPRTPTACQPGGGGAMCIILSGIPTRAPVKFQMIGSNFTDNSATIGGAIVISTAEEVEWTDVCPPSNVSTASLLTSDPCRHINLRNLRFVRNKATAAGGAVLVSNMKHIFYSDEVDDNAKIEYQTLDLVRDEGNYEKNRVGAGGYGPNIAGVAVRVEITSPTVDNSTGLLIANQSGGVSNQLPRITLQIVDDRGQLVTAGITDSVASISARSTLPGSTESIATGELVSKAEAGLANFTALTLSADPARYTLSFFIRNIDVEEAEGEITLRNCTLGEQYNAKSFVCEECAPESFTFFSNTPDCVACPDNGRCSGRASLIPIHGYWHSSPFSVIMHQCFQDEACSYDQRTETLETQRLMALEEFMRRFDAIETPVFAQHEYTQCAMGYDGPLCGSCADGYGHADGKACVRCVNRSAAAAVVFLLAVWQLIFLGITIRSALVSIRDMNQLAAIAQQQTTIPTQSSRRHFSQGGNFMVPVQQPSHRSYATTIESAGEMTGSEMEAHYATIIAGGGAASTAPVAPAQVRQQFSVDYIIAAQHVSETIKIFVNFFQITSVGVNINLQWTNSIKKMLASMNSVAGFSNGATFTPMTCLLDSDHDVRAIHGVILRIAFPLALMVVAMLFFLGEWFMKRRGPLMTHKVSQRLLRSRVTIVFLVVGFFAYQSISEDLMGTVSCIELDSTDLSDARKAYDNPDNNINYTQFSIARKRYWTEDTNIECFSRDHAYLAGFLGIPGIILFLFGVPFYLLVFLLYKRFKGELMALNVLNTYGFIYQNYENKYVYWEVCILIRKALISAIVVFAYPLGANLQGIMGLGVLIIALAFHLIAVPFKYILLNILEGLSLVVSIITFYAGVVFNDENTSDAGKVLLSVIVIILNASLFIAFIATALVYSDRYVIARLKFMDVQNIPTNALSRMFLLASMLSNKATAAIRSTVHQTLRRQRSNVAARKATRRQTQLAAMQKQQNVDSSDTSESTQQPAEAVISFPSPTTSSPNRATL